MTKRFLNNITRLQDCKIMKIGFFEEAEGVKSSMRMNCHISLWAGIAIALFSVATNQVDANTIALSTLFIVAAFAPKAIQKFAEVKDVKGNVQ